MMMITKKEIKMKKLTAILMVMVLGLVISGCATNNTRQGAMMGAGAGTIAAVIANRSPVTSAILIMGGMLLGGAIGNEMDEQAKQASLRHPNKRVLIVEEEPTERTDCKKVTTKEWKNGKIIKETTREVCTGKKTSNTY
jgi:chromate transport protein ChrA